MCLLCWCLALHVDLPSCNTLFFSNLCCANCLITYWSLGKAMILIYIYIYICHGWNCIFGPCFLICHCRQNNCVKISSCQSRENERKVYKLCCGSREILVELRSLSCTSFLQDCFKSVPGLLQSTPRTYVKVMNLNFLPPLPIFCILGLISKSHCVCVWGGGGGKGEREKFRIQ
jgi:hypothetical protein